MKNQYILLILVFLSVNYINSQFILDGEFRPRTEYRNGFGSIIPDAADPGYAISTRTRLNAGYKFSSYEFYISLQDVMVWGGRIGRFYPTIRTIPLLFFKLGQN